MRARCPVGLTPDTVPTPTLEAFAAEYFAWSRVHHTASTHATRRRLVEGVLLPAFGPRRLDEVTAQEVRRFLASLDRIGPATSNRVLTAISALFRRAEALGYVTSNPAASVQRAREPVQPIPLVSLEQQDALIARIPEAPRLLFVAALETGARLGELLRLRTTDVDPAERRLLFRQTKAGRPRLLRMSKRLADAFRAAGVPGASSPHGRRVFADAVGADGNLRYTWRHAFKKAARSIGFPELRIHDLRHLAAVNLVRAGVDLPTVQAFLGHRHLVSTLRYAAYADETATARAARALDRMRRQTPGEEEPAG